MYMYIYIYIPMLNVENMALGFVNLENTYDTVPREMTTATLRWMGVPEAEVRMVEGPYEEAKGRVVCRLGLSEEFRVDVGLRQGSAISPLLFIAGGGDDRWRR